MLIITEDHKMVSARMCEGKGISIGTHPEIPDAQLAVIDTEHWTVDAVIGTFRTVEDAERAKDSIREANASNRLPWDVNEFKRNLNNSKGSQ